MTLKDLGDSLGTASMVTLWRDANPGTDDDCVSVAIRKMEQEMARMAQVWRPSRSPSAIQQRYCYIFDWWTRSLGRLPARVRPGHLKNGTLLIHRRVQRDIRCLN
jgi:hypothetical protein